MDEKTRAVVRAVINERLSKALNAGSGFTFEEEKMIQLGADWGAEAMEEIMREREAKLVAALEKLSMPFDDGPGMFIARQFEDRIRIARAALAKLKGKK